MQGILLVDVHRSNRSVSTYYRDVVVSRRPSVGDVSNFDGLLLDVRAVHDSSRGADTFCAQYRTDPRLMDPDVVCRRLRMSGFQVLIRASSKSKSSSQKPPKAKASRPTGTPKLKTPAALRKWLADKLGKGWHIVTAQEESIIIYDHSRSDATMWRLTLGNMDLEFWKSTTSGNFEGLVSAFFRELLPAMQAAVEKQARQSSASTIVVDPTAIEVHRPGLPPPKQRALPQRTLNLEYQGE